MTADNIRTHKRKNSHLFNEQNTSGSSIRTDYDTSMDNLELENLAPPPIGRTTSIPSVPRTVPDLERQTHTSEAVPASAPFLSWDNIYLTNRFATNKRKMGAVLTLLVIFILTLVIYPLLTKAPRYDNGSKTNNNANSSEKSFTIENVMKGDFQIRKRNFHFIDPPYAFTNQDMDPGLYMTTETTDDETRFYAKQLFDTEFSKDLGPNRFEYNGVEYLVETIKVSFALDKLIFGTTVIDNFRHSSTANYWIKDVESGSIRPITPYFDSDGALVRMSYVRFSPGYNFIYFVFNNNLYFQDIHGQHAPVSVTIDGSADIFNAKTDWIYEEEVFADDEAIWWAPDDSKFMFAKFNDTEVDDYTFPRYTTNQQYSPLTNIKYPKPSRSNPKVQLYFYSIGGGQLFNVNMDHPESDEIILYDAEWVGPENFLFKITDRYSKELSVKVFNTDKIELLNTRSYNTSEYNGWVEKSKKLFVIPPNEENKRNNYGYIDVQPDNEGFNHLFYYDTPQASEGRQLTDGNWEVTGTGILAFDYETDTVYFTGNMFHTMSQNLFAVSIDDKAKGVVVLQNPSDKHSFYDYKISSSTRFGVMEYEGPHIPVAAAGPLTQVLSESNYRDNNALVLSDEEKRNTILQNYDLPITSYKTTTLQDGTEINYVEIKPRNMDAKRKHPLLVNVYGGPGSQTFTSKNTIALEQAVVSGLQAIVLQIEPRGTGGKGWKYRSYASKQLGYWEPRDIEEVTRKFISENENHINMDRVAIWGWSYGGFVTLKTVEFDKGSIFKYAIAVAPVTNWLYYDSIYTERYMGEVGKNIKSYIEISRVADIESFRNINRLLLMHGTSDDNVHVQNTFEFVDKLNLANVRNYDMHIFPDSDHSIRFHNAQSTIYKKLYYWLQEAFQGNLDDIIH